MKSWPTRRTNLQGVSQRSQSELRYWQFRLFATAKSMDWLRSVGDFPKGMAEFEKDQTINLRELEIVRRRCRREDIESRWAMRWFNRQYRTAKIEQSRRWLPWPMGYDQVHRGRKLVEL